MGSELPWRTATTAPSCAPSRLCMLISAGLSGMIRAPSPHGLGENQGRKEVSPFCFISDAGNLTQ